MSLPLPEEALWDAEASAEIFPFMGVSLPAPEGRQFAHVVSKFPNQCARKSLLVVVAVVKRFGE